MAALTGIPRHIQIAGTLIAVGMVSSGFYWYGGLKASQSLSWPSTSGTVLSCGASRSWLTGKGYCADIAYAYSVGGQAYTSSRVQFQPASEGRIYTRVLKQLATQYPVGGEVSVFYDPADPASAIVRQLAPDWSRGWWMLGALSALGLILGGGEWLRGRV